MKRFLGGFGFLNGTTYPWRTLITFVKKPHLWGYLGVPLTINFVLAMILYISGLIWGWQEIASITEQLKQNSTTIVSTVPMGISILQAVETVLQSILTILFTIVLLIIIGFVLTQFGFFLGLPWYIKLSEELERIKTGKVKNIEVGVIKDLGRALSFELNKLILLIGFGVPLLLINLIPVWGNLISSLGGITLSSTLIALDFLDAPLERRKLSFKKKLNLIKSSLPASAGFALVCLALVSIPLLNLLTIPLCVASGTLFFCDYLQEKIENK